MSTTSATTNNSQGQNILSALNAGSGVEDLDYAAAVSKLNQQTLALQAAQSSFAKVSQLNLFNYLN